MRKFTQRQWLFLLLITSMLTGFAGCETSQDQPHKRIRKLPDRVYPDKLVAITSYSPIAYFIYQGEPMGYEYELLSMLGEHLNIPIEIKLARDIDEMIQMLHAGEGDLIAYGLTITAERRKKLAFTQPMNVTRQVLVQRKPQLWRQMKLHEIENQLVRTPFDLVDETIYVRSGSAYQERLQNLSLEIGSTIQLVEAAPNLTTEDLIRLVALDSIDFTVADENIAKIQSAYYRNLDVSTPLSLPQQTAWAVRLRSKTWLDTLNNWLNEIQKQADYYVIYNKYYKNRQAFRSRYASEFNPVTGGSISPYDDLFKAGAERLSWDWRLLAALAYRESRFDPNARSWAGASGLMQLMPRTAKAYGADDPYDPEQNIEAGVNFLLWLEDYWAKHIPDENERIQFVLASYNVGQGHVQDARKLAVAFDADQNVWENQVERFMLKKSNPEYYNIDFVNHGYASGIEPVTYVRTINELYRHYSHFVD